MLFRPDPERTLARMRRSWQARARRLVVLCVAALDADDTSGRPGLRERLRRQVVRLNESTLMIDAQLAESVPELADVHARRLFDAELALANCARFANALASSVFPTPVGPEKMNEPIGRRGSLSPARLRRIEREMARIASSCPITVRCSSSSIRSKREVSAS